MSRGEPVCSSPHKLSRPHPVHYLHVMTQVFQFLKDVFRQFFHPKLIGPPLMVDARSSEGFVRSHSVSENVDEVHYRLADDGWSSSGAEGKDGSPVR